MECLSWSAIFQPFDVYNWVCLLLSAPSYGSVLYFLRRFYFGSDESATLWDDIWDIIKISCGDSVKVSYPPFSVMILLYDFMALTLILITGYTGIFTAIVTVPKYVHPLIDTLEQLWKSNMK